IVKEQVVYPCRERYLTSFPFGRLGVRDVQEVAGEIDVFPSLVEDLSPAHAGIQGNNRDVAEMRRSGFEEEFLLGEAQDRPFLPTLPFEADTGDRICGNESLVNCPVEEMAEALDIPVHGRFGDGLRPVALHAVLSDPGLRDADDLLVREMGQQDL